MGMDILSPEFKSVITFSVFDMAWKVLATSFFFTFCIYRVVIK